MILLTTTGQSLEVKLGGVVATSQLPFVAGFADLTTTAFTPGSNNGATNNTTAVTLAAAPAASAQRQIKFLSIQNADTAAATVTVQLNDTATLRTICKVALAVGDLLYYVDGQGFYVVDANGALKESQANILSSLTVTGNATVSGTLDVTGVLTFTAQPILSSLTASQAVFTDGSKGLVSNAITGSGNVVMSASPTLTGTITAAELTLSGNLGVTGVTTLTGVGARLAFSGAGTGNARASFINTGGNVIFGVESSTGGALLASTAAYAAVFATDNATTFYIGTNSIIAIAIDASQKVTLAGNLVVSGAGPHAIGGGTDTDTQLNVVGTYNGGVTNAVGMWFRPILGVPVNGDGVGLNISFTLNKAGSGTHAGFVGIQAQPPIIGAGAAALTNASTVKITGAPTEATNNYALWVAAGTVCLGTLAGTGSRTVVADANGVLSAP